MDQPHHYHSPHNHYYCHSYSLGGGEAWRKRTVMLSLVTVAVISQQVGMVAKGEFVHKNFTAAETESVGVGDSRPASTSASSPSSSSSPSVISNLRDEDASLGDSAEGVEVRCYCNLPRCVTLGYMCKSLLGACFTNDTPTHAHANAQSSTHTHAQHHRWTPMYGCVELLPRERQAECARKGGLRRPKQGGEGALDLTPASPDTLSTTQPPSPLQPDPALTCCRHDMCNYRDLDVYIRVEGDSHTDIKRQDSETETLWFRAATIAVPIAGGFILIVLVLLASKMLSKENKRQRMAQQVLGEHYLKTALYPGGSSAALTHTAICCHPPLTKAAHINEISLINTCEEKNPIYKHPDGHVYNIDEIKPLNLIYQEDRWDQREAESPPLS